MTSPLSKTNKLGKELTMKSIGTLEPMISGASNSTSANPILFSGAAGHGEVAEVRILLRSGEMVLHGGQYEAVQYVINGTRLDVLRRMVS